MTTTTTLQDIVALARYRVHMTPAGPARDRWDDTRILALELLHHGADMSGVQLLDRIAVSGVDNALTPGDGAAWCTVLTHVDALMEEM